MFLCKVSESKEIEKRKFNLILHGIKESENGEDGDVDLVNEILRSISIDPVRHVDRVSRVGHAATDKVRPTRIKFKTLDGRSEILRRAKNLNPLDARSRYTDFVETSLRHQKSVYRLHGISTPPPKSGIPAAWYINATGQKPVYRICFLMRTGTGMPES